MTVEPSIEAEIAPSTRLTASVPPPETEAPVVEVASAAIAASDVIVVLSTAEWWGRLSAHAADHGVDVEVVTVRDGRALLESGLQVVCCDDTVVWFTKAMVDQAVAGGVQPPEVAVSDSPRQGRSWKRATGRARRIRQRR